MKTFERLRLLARLDRWDDRIDRERDLCLRAMAALGPTSELVAWMDDLDTEQLEHRALTARYKQDRDKLALVLVHRPNRMLKVVWPVREKARKQA